MRDVLKYLAMGTGIGFVLTNLGLTVPMEMIDVSIALFFLLATWLATDMKTAVCLKLVKNTEIRRMMNRVIKLRQNRVCFMLFFSTLLYVVYYASEGGQIYLPVMLGSTQLRIDSAMTAETNIICFALAVIYFLAGLKRGERTVIRRVLKEKYNE